MDCIFQLWRGASSGHRVLQTLYAFLLIVQERRDLTYKKTAVSFFSPCRILMDQESCQAAQSHNIFT